jgi:CubicO group peptidase (beta-lactamase class C family)
MILLLSTLLGCRPSSNDLDAVDYTPLHKDDWDVSTPEEQKLDPMLVAELYRNAAELETIYGLLVIKNGNLIAEGYFNNGAVEKKHYIASATKSFTSALVGIALDQGCLSSVDQKMMEFFPEYSHQIDDKRKDEITIRDLLQMRSGYVWEEHTAPYMKALFDSRGYWLPFVVDFPLSGDPGTRYGYSNLSTHLLGIIVARSCDTDLKTFAQEYLFSPIGAEVGDWEQDADGNYYGAHGIPLTARDMARFGLLYLNNGESHGEQIISTDWIKDSLQRYSENINISGWLPGFTSRYGYYRNLGYGYQWWSANAGEHQFNYASGHGGNQIILLDALDMVIVVSADRLFGHFGGNAWTNERAIIDMVGKFINSLPNE